MNTLLNDRKI